MAEPSPEMQDHYKTAQGRFNQHIAVLKTSGKSTEAAGLEASLHAAKVDPGISEHLDAAMQKGRSASAGGRFEEVEKDYKEAISLAEKLQPPDDRLEKCILALAFVYAAKKDFTHAEAAFQRALKVTEDLHGAESPLMVEPLQALGHYMISRQDYNSAFDYFSRAVALDEKTYGETSNKVADSLRVLSFVYYAQKDYAKAEPYLLRAVRIDESLYGADGAGMNVVLWNLCNLYDKWNKPEKAEPRYLQMLAILEKQYGPDSPVLISSLAAEANTLRKLGRAEEAAKYEQRAQSIRTATGQTGNQAAAQVPN
jgi:tetratricopeptide (TPR) repeat protein